ncbi:MAG: glycosyltransferase family 2 protein [Flavobacteriales bacterium]|nr:glycosyltransferase family 2 protein [Flavobacteriales bacterium]
MAMGTIAVVVLNWNGEAWLRRFLPEVVRNTAGARIVLADNGSTDGSVAWVSGTLPEVEILRLTNNLGFAGGYNAALAQLNSDYFVLLNSDVEVRPGWLEGLRNLLERNPDMAACQPKVLAQRDPSRFEHAGAAGGFIDRNGYPFCRGRIFELTEEDRGQYDDERDVFWATGACLMVRREAFEAVAGFDASLFAHMEERSTCAGACAAKVGASGIPALRWCTMWVEGRSATEAREKPTSTSATVLSCSQRTCATGM